MFDLRSRYAFDASEGQIPEGAVSGYGHANEKANCVPASFTAALLLAGFPDIDPEQVTVDIYGLNYRGGFGNFTRTIDWIRAMVPNAPTFSDGPFDFNAAEAAGQAGQLIIVAGWIIPSSVTFAAQSVSGGFSHASLLVAHLPGDKYVIWNTWFGQMQTYDRAVLAASLYEMSIASGLHGGGSGSLGGEDLLGDERQWLQQLYSTWCEAHPGNDVSLLTDLHNTFSPTATPTGALGAANKTWAAWLIDLRAAIDAIKPGTSAATDNTAVLNAIAALKGELDVVSGDLATVKRLIEKDLAP